MPDMRDDLIRWFTSHKVDDIRRGDPQYQQLCERYKKNPLFNGERDAVEVAKNRLENQLDGATTHSEQVRAALTELSQRRLERNRDLYYELIVEAYKPNWLTRHQTYFEEAWKLISSEYDFFFSFTTRYAPAGGENPINTQYKYFIISEITKPAFNAADRSKENLLATALYRILAQPPFRGFFFKEYENNNTVTEKKLRDACAKAIVFVQVVQNIIFVAPAGRTNYCFFEYNEAISSIHDPNRLLFVVAEKSRVDLVPSFRVPPPYGAWHAHVLSKDPPYLEEARYYSSKQIRDLREKVEATIVQKVKDVQQRIFDNVPL